MNVIKKIEKLFYILVSLDIAEDEAWIISVKFVIAGEEMCESIRKSFLNFDDQR